MKTIIQTPAPNYAKSCEFYNKIGFESIIKNDKTYVYSKGVTIEINKDHFSRAGIKCFGTNWDVFLKERELTDNATKTKNGYLITSPAGCCVYLEDPIDDLPENNTKPVIGTYGGFGLETNQIEESLDFWSKFGYKQTMGNIEQGWLILSNDEGFKISLMKHQCCPHAFFNPSLSYFNGKENLAIIENIRNLTIEITEEITHFSAEGVVDNIIIRDPGGLGFFIFSD
jgi:hypothetical protein